jgi:carbon storage regulator CsrA
MLVITRKQGEFFCIEENIKITVLEIHGKQVKVEIEAPPNTTISEVKKEVEFSTS